MYFIFFLDYLASLAVNISMSMGAWIVYKTAGGIYYSVKWLTGGIPKQITEKEMDGLKPMVVITEEEYESLLANKTGLETIQKRLETIEHRLEHQ